MSYLKPNTLRLGGSRMERGSRGLAAAAAASLGRASIGSSGRNSACSSGSVSPIPIIAISTGDESSESEIEAEPARIFHRRVSTKRNINSTAAIKEGFLLKQTWSFQRWRRRYFRLKRNKLYYAKDGKYPLQSNNRSNPRYVVTGTIGQLYHKFIEQLNGTFKIMPIKNMSRADYYDFYITLASRKVIDIGIQPYPEMLLMANMTEGSYPVGQTSNCIIVPVATKVQKYSYSTKSAIKSPLILDLCRIISLALLDVLSYGSLEFDLRRIGRAVWFAYGTLLLQSVEHRRSRFLAILALAILFSLIMSNIFLAVVTAGFSTILPDRQISTLNDFLQSDLKILMTNFHYNAFFKNGFIPAALEDRFIITKEDIFWKHCESLNTSYAYFVGAELWSMLQLKQKRLPMPRFRKAGEELCTPRVFLKFPIQRDSPFAKSLSVFIKYAQESGLDLKWRELGTQQAIDMQGIKVIEEKVEHPVPLSISHIEEVLYLCFIMWAFALTCFLFELLWHWWTSRENRQIIS